MLIEHEARKYKCFPKNILHFIEICWENGNKLLIKDQLYQEMYTKDLIEYTQKTLEKHYHNVSLLANLGS